MSDLRRPAERFEVDWLGNGHFGHPASDLSARVLEYVVHWGCPTSAHVQRVGYELSRGIVRLANDDDLLTPGQPGSVDEVLLRRPTRYRLTVGDIVREGACEVIDDLSDTPPPYGTATLRLGSRWEASLRWPVRLVDEEAISVAVLLADARRTPVLVGLPALPITYGGDRLLGPVRFEGSWPELLNRLGRLSGGWFTEADDGTIQYASLDDALAAVPVVLDDTYRPDARDRPYPLRAAIANVAEYRAARMVLGDDADQIRVPVATTAGDTATVSYSYRPTPTRWGYVFSRSLLADSSITVDQGSLYTSLTEFRASFTASVTGITEVTILGRPLFPVESYRFVDGSDPTDASFIASAVRHGAVGLDLPPWQPTVAVESDLQAQRIFLRRLRSGLARLSTTYPVGQPDDTRAAVLAGVGCGDVASIANRGGTSRTLVLNKSLRRRPGQLPRVTLGGLVLDDVPAVTVDDLPPLGLPGGPTVPPGPLTDVDDGGPLDEVFTAPPGSMGCTVDGGLVIVEWPDPVVPTEPLPSSWAGAYQRTTFTGNRVAYDRANSPVSPLSVRISGWPASSGPACDGSTTTRVNPHLYVASGGVVSFADRCNYVGNIITVDGTDWARVSTALDLSLSPPGEFREFWFALEVLSPAAAPTGTAAQIGFRVP